MPPSIVESLTSNDMVVREGTNVTLTCKAKGFPEPYVMWRREDGDEMAIGGENGRIPLFQLECAKGCPITTNGVPQSVIIRNQKSPSKVCSSVSFSILVQHFTTIVEHRFYGH